MILRRISFSQNHTVFKNIFKRIQKNHQKLIRSDINEYLIQKKIDEIEQLEALYKVQTILFGEKNALSFLKEENQKIIKQRAAYLQIPLAKNHYERNFLKSDY